MHVRVSYPFESPIMYFLAVKLFLLLFCFLFSQFCLYFKQQLFLLLGRVSLTVPFCYVEAISLVIISFVFFFPLNSMSFFKSCKKKSIQQATTTKLLSKEMLYAFTYIFWVVLKFLQSFACFVVLGMQGRLSYTARPSCQV